MRSRTWRVRSALAVLFLFLAAPLPAQTITDDLLGLLVQALRAEDAELDKAGPKLQELDERIRQFEECKDLYESAGDAAGGKLGGLAAKAAMKAKCGATSSEGWYKEKQKVREAPERAALSVIKLKAPQYGQLKERVGGYLGGSRDGFSAAELAALEGRRGELSGLLRFQVAAAGGGGGAPAGGGRARGARNINFSSSTYAWEYIGNMFQMMYLSGAMMFEKPYQQGQWTKWRFTRTDQVVGNEAPYTEKSDFERAFLGTGEDGGEWWRTTQVDYYDDGGTERADTVILEGLFKGDNEYVRQLVRMRGKFPGQKEPQELMVPQAFAMLSLLAAFPFRPTDESIKGATVGTDRIAGFDARHVKFGGSDGALEWWISDTAPGGWVRFRHTDADEGVKSPATYVMEMVQHGSGATSQLGVR